MIKIRLRIEVLRDELPRKKVEVEFSQAEAYRRKINMFQLFLYYACDSFIKVLGDYLTKGNHEECAGKIVQHEVNIKSEHEADGRKFIFNEPAEY